MVKHGWPARVELVPSNWGDGFQITYAGSGSPGPDFWNAAALAARIVGRTYALDLDIGPDGLIMFNRRYVVTSGGFFKEVKQ